jgi:hypothetical protein
MKQQDRGTWGGCHATNRTVISRRAAIGSSGLAVLSVLSASALGQERGSEPPREIQERMEQFRQFSERMRNAGSPEERTRIMEERNAWERTRAVEDLKRQLEVSDQEWTAIKPRVEAVYNLMQPQPQFGGPGNMRPMSPVDRGKSELRGVLSDKNAAADQIKAKLTALRAAQVNANQELARARQNLRQIMTLRQEATLVLNGLLD